MRNKYSYSFTDFCLPFLLFSFHDGRVIPNQCMPTNTQDIVRNPCRSQGFHQQQQINNLSHYMGMAIKAMLEQTKDILKKYVCIFENLKLKIDISFIDDELVTL